VSKRIAIAGFLHESHSFAPLATQFDQFVAPGGFPALSRGRAMFAAIAGTTAAAEGMRETVAAAGYAPLPLVWGFANPAGPVSDQAFEAILGEICAMLAAEHLRNGGVAGVLLDLHGAMLVDSFDDGEGEILRRVRAIVGPDVPVVASLDPHGNVSPAMVRLADALTPFRTYPHVDIRETGIRAAELLLRRLAHGRSFARALRQIDFLTPITAQCTMVEPMAGLMAERAALAAAPGVAELGLMLGFPYADFSDCSPAVFAYGESEREVSAATAALASVYADREPAFAGGVLDAADAVRAALAASAGKGTGPVVLADTQDNPGGGGHGDTTGLLAELIRQGATGVAFGLINDAEAAAACHAAGEGATLALALGGRSLPPPLAVTAKVLRLSDGSYVNAGPMTRGMRSELGPTALIEVAPGIEVVVTSRKTQAYDRMLFRHLGVEPEARRILALKSSVHFRADFQPIARAVLVAAAPGPVVADPATLPFTKLRPGLRRRPKANA
jgi:microcystin degradation protein MlrC